MKTIEELKKDIQHKIDVMTKEEFEQSLIDAGLDHYKNIKTKIFSKSKKTS
jgi:hypothetical protein